MKKKCLVFMLCAMIFVHMLGVAVLAQDVTVFAGATPGSDADGFNDWSLAWGIPDGTGIEMALIFSVPFIAPGFAQHTHMQEEIGRYFTINGVSIADRIDPSKKEELGIDDTPDWLWEQQTAVLTPITQTQLNLVLLGGGIGNIEYGIENVILISGDLPMETGTLGRDIMLVYDPLLMIWDEVPIAASEDLSDTQEPIEAPAETPAETESPAIAETPATVEPTATDEEPAPVETQSPAATATNPKTGDFNIGIIIAVFSVACVSMVLIKKARKVKN